MKQELIYAVVSIENKTAIAAVRIITHYNDRTMLCKRITNGVSATGSPIDIPAFKVLPISDLIDMYETQGQALDHVFSKQEGETK